MRRGLCLLIALLFIASLPFMTYADTALKMGDVDRNGDVSAADAAMLLRSIVRITVLDEAQKAVADVDGSGTVEASDASKILRWIVKLTPTLEIDGSFTKQSFQASSCELSYWLYTPKHAAVHMPLIIYLHGGSGKGDDLDLLIQNDGFPKYLKDGLLGDVPAFVIIPQLSEDNRGWHDIRSSIRELVDYAAGHYLIDSNKVSLTGHSMGGTGVWQIAVSYPNLFSRIAPLSGSVQNAPQNLEALKNLPVHAFVGSEDTIVSPDSSIQFVQALQKANAPAQITVFDGASHFDVPTLVFLNTEIDIIAWLIQ